MIITDIKSNTPEWKEARKKYVGASEIYSIAWHYFPDKLAKIAQELGYKLEKPFRSAYEIWHKIKYGHELEMKNKEDGIFGQEMEKYLKKWLIEYSEEFKGEEFIKDSIYDLFITNPDYHKLAACSPDILIKNKYLFELKTSRYLEKQEPKLKYIFQLSYQMAICQINCGSLIVAFSKDRQYDSDFTRGRILGQIEMAYIRCADLINDFFDVKKFPFETNQKIQQLCLEALDSLQFDLNMNNAPISIDFPFLYNDLKLKAMIDEQKFGPLDVTNTTLDQALEEFKYGKEQAASIYNELEVGAEYQIRLALLKNIELLGSNFRAYYDKGNKLRIQKL